MGALLRYHGGKARMAPRIVAMMPGHETYVEPFGGGAAVLLAKPRARLEVYNDLDTSMVTFFRVLRDRPQDLERAVALTPFARAEHVAAYEPTDDPLEIARRVAVRSHFGFGSNGIHRATGFRAAGLRASTLPVHIWARHASTIAACAERMAGVVIEQRPAVQVMQAHDAVTTVHYVDPPYLASTRGTGTDYAHEMTDADHIGLLQCVTDLRGSVILSGYASDLYDDALSDWDRVEVETHADGARPRTEVIWSRINHEGLFA